MVSTDLNFSAILIIGPTASGKTAIAHFLADELLKENKVCELVNLDAFQIYKELNIGTAKPNAQEIKKYLYHGFDLLELHESLDAHLFAKEMWKICTEIKARGHIPLCVGGSGLYLRAFLHGLDQLPPRSKEIRAEIRDVALEKGWPWCHQWLSKVDPVRAAELHPNDKVRIERALEVFLSSGKPLSALRTKTEKIGEQETLFSCYVIHVDRIETVLKERIYTRTDFLLKQGWIEEVKNLFEVYGEKLFSWHSMQAIGYREILNFILDDTMTDEELAKRIETLTWQYAKRQRTWNAKEKKDFSLQSFSAEERIALVENVCRISG